MTYRTVCSVVVWLAGWLFACLLAYLLTCLLACRFRFRFHSAAVPTYLGTAASPIIYLSAGRLSCSYVWMDTVGPFSALAKCHGGSRMGRDVFQFGTTWEGLSYSGQHLGIEGFSYKYLVFCFLSSSSIIIIFVFVLQHR